MNQLDPTFVLSNRIEAGFWIVTGIALLVASFRLAGVAAKEARLGALVFAIFGGSDIVEATTGAWWRPWWLLAWKGLCLLALVVLLIRYIKRRKNGQSS